jgi:hypothetical protein
MRLKSSIGSAFDSVMDSTRLRYKINYPQKLSLQNNFAEIFFLEVAEPIETCSMFRIVRE